MRSDTRPNAREDGFRGSADASSEAASLLVQASAARGFTVVELMVAVAVVAILVRIAVPALHGFMMSNSMTAATNQLVASLNYARNQAITQRAVVRLCKTATATATTPTCDTSSSTGYDEGWFIYNTYYSTASASSVTTVLKTVVPNSASNIGIKGSSATIPNEVAFNAFGFPGTVNSSGTFTAITNPVYFALCDSRGWATSGLFARVISISKMGTIISQTGDRQTTANVTSCSP